MKKTFFNTMVFAEFNQKKIAQCFSYYLFILCLIKKKFSENNKLTYFSFYVLNLFIVTKQDYHFAEKYQLC